MTIALCGADLPEVPAGLPSGEEAKRPPGVCCGAAAVRAGHWEGVGARTAGLHLPNVPTGGDRTIFSLPQSLKCKKVEIFFPNVYE